MNQPTPSTLPLLDRRRLLQGTAALATLGPSAWAHAQGDAWRIGQTAALTGPLAFPFVEMNKGIAAAFKEVNDRGGIDGRPVEFFSLDDGGAPEKAAENTATLLKKDQVFTMFACGGTTSVMGALKVLAEAKVPLLAPATGSDALRPFNPLVFHTRASYAQELAKIARQLSSTGFTKMAVGYFDNPFGKATLAAFEAAARATNNTQWKPFLVQETPEGIEKAVQEIVQFQPN
ncbi:MAG TPA: ABC transporter substrate-binding protein, partial [Giesbergeria sp.]|nr:ABC transporter substrate-binding protein [Giesbergeria sp.]